jgi:hypothetical protein
MRQVGLIMDEFDRIKNKNLECSGMHLEFE